MLYPLKFKAILPFSPLKRIHQLQSLQGKDNFLCRFIASYAEIMKGFMRLLKKGVPFYWDDQVQWSFEALKNALMTTPLLSPQDFIQDFILYLASSNSKIGMVLVQDDS